MGFPWSQRRTARRRALQLATSHSCLIQSRACSLPLVDGGYDCLRPPVVRPCSLELQRRLNLLTRCLTSIRHPVALEEESFCIQVPPVSLLFEVTFRHLTPFLFIFCHMGNQQIKSCSNVPASDSTTSDSAASVKPTMMPRSTSIGHRMMESHQDEPEAVFLPLALHKRVEQMSAEPRYLPRGLEKAHNGIRVPRMPTYAIEPAGSSGSAEGVESPQWGWFLRTTPPTPQMYSRFHQKSDTSMASQNSNDSSSTSTVPGSHPNPVFQGMHDRHKAAPMGWSSVPL
ncbi:hypothetical protein MPSEU_000708000 [Mayamaea pseudoterrestris]|nr:hypothetical protein MPSEU_000708000 [Mayamaea pseudoterrestris]